jgi:hypothetical protein
MPERDLQPLSSSGFIQGDGSAWPPPATQAFTPVDSFQVLNTRSGSWYYKNIVAVWFDTSNLSDIRSRIYDASLVFTRYSYSILNNYTHIAVGWYGAQYEPADLSDYLAGDDVSAGLLPVSALANNATATMSIQSSLISYGSHTGFRMTLYPATLTPTQSNYIGFGVALRLMYGARTYMIV